VVARAIAHELEVCRLKEPVVYLDLTHLKADHIRTRFPRIYETCLKYNVDITVDQVPIRPAAHYLMGGIRTDLDARSSLPGLYAAGEAACTGVHGANRLASNSLLEGLVFGARAADTMIKEAKHGQQTATAQAEPLKNPGRGIDAEAFIHGVQQLMWNKVGIVRSRQSLTEAIQQLQTSAQELPPQTSRRNCEARNIHTAALLIARSALARLESRGAHYRTDYPQHDDSRFKKHSIVGEKGVRFV
jgi:L-aspartate oxidase